MGNDDVVSVLAPTAKAVGGRGEWVDTGLAGLVVGMLFGALFAAALLAALGYMVSGPLFGDWHATVPRLLVWALPRGAAAGGLLGCAGALVSRL